MLICITGASGSGKSTLVNEILYKRLHSLYHDSRTLYGAHEALEGHQHLNDVINIDQSPIGRSPRSNPATYIKFYDNIRKLFASTPLALERGYTASRFSFNVKGGRCEECHGEGTITTQLTLCRMLKSFARPVKVPAIMRIRLMLPITTRISLRSSICQLRMALRSSPTND